MNHTLTPTNLQGLNEKQSEAVTSQEKRILVLAGAGSGKTRTLLEKINYLINEEQAESKSILALTFTKNAANEMLDRMILAADSSGYYKEVLATDGVKPEDIDKERKKFLEKYSWLQQITFKTFHSFCYQIMRNDGVHVFDNQFKMVSQDQKSAKYAAFSSDKTESELIQGATIKLCQERNFILLLKRYILDYYVDYIKEDEGKSEYRPDGKYFTTLNSDRVRSKSEQYIADWLFRNSIEYVYERKERVGKKSFHPDFFIPSANLYLEHVSDKSYPTYWKEMEFRKAGQKCVKTYDKATRNSAIFNQMLDKVIKGQICDNLESAKVLNYHEEFAGFKEELNKFFKQVMDIKSTISSSNKSFADIVAEAAQSKHARVRLFYQLAIPIIKEYYAECVDKSLLDFDGLIDYSIKLFEENPEIKNRYQNRFKYVLVDEFQDVNHSQVDLLKLLVNDNTQLFCVGDDWQSIYGFRGSEIDYIVNFKKHFSNSKLITLDYNYRSTDTIVKASNEIIKNNNFQIPKDIKSVNQAGKNIEVFYSECEGQEESFIWERIQQHLEGGVKPDEILVLYRRSSMSKAIEKLFYERGIKVQFKTIHGAKGLEAKVVFILGLNASQGGFPDPWLQDKINQVVKKTGHDILLEEERRLFYVAVTRAKEHLYLMSKKGSVSDFVKEIPKALLECKNDQTLPVGPVVKLCSSCKKLIKPDYKYCPECGFDIENKKPMFNDQDEIKRSGNWIKEEAQKTYSNAYEPWTANDDNELEKLYCQGVENEKLMIHFNRSEGGIKSRIEKLELEDKYK